MYRKCFCLLAVKGVLFAVFTATRLIWLSGYKCCQHRLYQSGEKSAGLLFPSNSKMPSCGGDMSINSKGEEEEEEEEEGLKKH
jgi:hypothetical protein